MGDVRMELEDNGNLKLEIDEPKGWCPKIGEKFYTSFHSTAEHRIVVDEYIYDGSVKHRFIMQQGGCYKTHDEAYDAQKSYDDMIEAVMARFDIIKDDKK